MLASRRVLACLGMLWSASIGLAQSVRYVDDAATGPADGKSWCNAYRHLQDALAAAAGGGVTEIRVAQGTYKPDRSSAAPLGTGSANDTSAW